MWGSDLYTADSSICRAAVHAGIIKQEGGKVTVYPMPGQGTYDGSTRNGVSTSDYGAYGGSFAFRADVQADKVARCNQASLQEGNPVTCRCRAEDTQSGGVYGTDVYTSDSSICRAALHAGVIPASGGMVTVTAGPGRKSYTASARNGVSASAWGEFGGSFSFRKVP